MSEVMELDARKNNFDCFTSNIGDITPQWDDIKRSDGVIERRMNAIKYQDSVYNVGRRFITSLCSKFGIGESIFYLYDPAEVFERIQKVHPRCRIRIATEVVGPTNVCLAATAPNKSFVDYSTLMRIITHHARLPKIKFAKYEEGVVTTVHVMGDAPWELSGELFHQAFTLETPIDGYGLPSIYLSLIRESNETLLTAESKTFRSEVQLGKDSDKPEIPLGRALNTFNNEEGFQALRQRLDSARTSHASLHECDSMMKTMRRAVNHAMVAEAEEMFKSYLLMTGDVSKKYGIATEDSLSPKKARLLPMDCSILDLIFFNMEVTSHRGAILNDDRCMTQWVGQVMDNEYDLEGSMKAE